MFLQLNPPVPLVTPKGKAWAIGMIDYGPHWDLQWITFLHDSGECWTFLNRDIRQEDNYTFGIGKPSTIAPHKSIINGNVHPLNGSANGHATLNGHDSAIAHDYADSMRPQLNGRHHA